MTSATNASESTVLGLWTDTLVRALEERGYDAQAMAADAGISIDELRAPGSRVALDASTRLWKSAIVATGDPCLGVDVSRYVRSTSFHALSQAVLASPTLREALERIARYSRIVSDLAVVTTEADGDTFSLIITWGSSGLRPAFEPVDAILCAIVRAARFALETSLTPVEVRLERPEPEGSERFRAFFRCPVSFGEPDTRLVFDAATVELRLVAGDADLAYASDSVVAAYLAQLETPTTMAQRVRDVLIELLPSGEPHATAVARALTISPRSLQRRLDEEGTTFREVLQAVRHDLAIAYLRSGHQGINEISHRLGFSDPAAFSRAFKRWTGRAPSQFE